MDKVDYEVDSEGTNDVFYSKMSYVSELVSKCYFHFSLNNVFGGVQLATTK